MAEEVFVPTDEAEENEATETPEDERDAMIRAAEASGVENTEEEKSDRDDKGRFKKTEAEKAKASQQANGAKGKPGVDPKDPPSNAIAKELAKRNERRQEQSEYRSKAQEADQLISQVKSRMAAIEQRESEVSAKMQELNETLASIRRDPMGAMQKMGWKAEDFIRNAERQNDPTYQEIIGLQSELSKRDEVIDKLTKRLDRLDDVEKNYSTQAKQVQAQAEVQEFWASLPEDSPVFTDDRFEDRDDIIARARKVRERYYNATIDPRTGEGKVATPKEVAQYLHYEALKRRDGAPKQTSGLKPGKAGQTQAKVPRALGSGDSSERRGGSAKHVQDMTAAEERQYLIDVANQAVADE